MTGTSMRSQVISGDAILIGNTPLEELMHGELERLGPPLFDEADRAMARRFQATFSPADIATSFRRFGVKPRGDLALADSIYPLGGADSSIVGSTDVGTVSRSEEHTSELQ